MSEVQWTLTQSSANDSFSAAHAASHFKEFEAYAFHNCVYEFLYTRMEDRIGVDTDSLLKRIDQTWMLIIVGDAWMSPYELTHRGGAIYYAHNNPVPGIEWLRRLRRKVPRSAWLNPEPERFGQARVSPWSVTYSQCTE